MSYVNRPPRGQQRDKPYREALRMELAAAGEDRHEQDAEQHAPHAADATPTRYAQRASYHRRW